MPNIISQGLFVSMKMGFQYISSQIILILGLIDWVIFHLHEWFSDSAGETPTHSEIFVL